MDCGMSREEALALLNESIQNENLIKHCLATESVMKALADKMGQEIEKWGLAGLLHDLDVELGCKAIPPDTPLKQQEFWKRRESRKRLFGPSKCITQRPVGRCAQRSFIMPWPQERPLPV